MEHTIKDSSSHYRADTTLFRNRLIWGISGLVLSLLGFIFVSPPQLVFNIISLVVFVMASWITASAVFAGTSKVSISETEVTFKSFMYSWVVPWDQVIRLELENTIDPDRIKREYAKAKLWGKKKTLLGQIDLMAFQDVAAEKIVSALRHKATSCEIAIERT